MIHAWLEYVPFETDIGRFIPPLSANTLASQTMILNHSSHGEQKRSHIIINILCHVNFQ